MSDDKKKKTSTPARSGGKKKSTNKRKSKNVSLWQKIVNWFKGLFKPSAVKKIYKTTDGYFNNKPKIKKPRRVAVVDQRKKDGAVAVVKIYSKNERGGEAYIPDLTLTPDKHPSLTEDSIVGKQVYIGVKTGDTYKTINTRDFETTSDSLTNKELKRFGEVFRTIRRNIEKPIRTK